MALRCVSDFGWAARGTPAPIAPPQRLVAVGCYRYLRNPMYVGFAAGWIGLGVIFGHPNPRVISAVAAVAVACICSSCFMKNRHCVRSSDVNTKSISET